MIGVDVGGTTVKSALVKVGDPKNTASYVVLKTAVVKTEKENGRESVLNSIAFAVKSVAKKGIIGVGVGSAGDVIPDTGIVNFATDALPNFTGLNLYADLNKRLRRATVVINDASAATIGECYFGAGRGYKKVLVLTLGTGLGCSLYTAQADGLTSKTVVNYRLGHIELKKGGRKCLCNKLGCAEQYVSATALRQNAQEAGFSDNPNELIEAYRTGDEKAKCAVVTFFEDFVKVLEYAEKEYSPEVVLVGGGISEIEGWWEDFVAYAAEYVKVPLKRAELKNRAGFLGAVYNALNGIYTHQKGVTYARKV